MISARPPRRAAAALALGLVAALLVPPPARAQRPAVTTFSVGEGLPSGPVRALAQDRTGRLWLVSRGRIAVFDGTAFEVLGAAQGLPRQPLAALAIDAHGRILAVERSEPRVHRREGASWRALPLPDRGGRPVGWCTALAAIAREGREDVVVATAWAGLLLWDGASWSSIGPAEGLPAESATTLLAFGSAVAVGTPAGLCRLSGRRLDCSWRDRDPRLREPILALAPSPAGAERLLVLTPQWLGSLEGGRLTVLAERLGLGTDPEGSAIGADRTGGIYFGSSQQAYFLDPDDGRARRFGQDQGLAGEGALAVLADDEGGVWIGGWRGLSRVGSRRFLSFDERDGLAESEVSAVALASPGRLVLGHNGALTFFGEAGPVARPLPRSSARARDADRVVDLAADAGGTVWGAALSLGLLEVRGDRRVQVHRFPSRVRSVEVDARGRLWVLDDDGLLVRRQGRLDRLEIGPGLSGIGYRRWLTTGADGRLFVATNEGLWWRDGLDAEPLSLRASWKQARGPDADANDVYAVLSEPGSTRVGTRAGLFQLEGDRLVPAAGVPSVHRPVYFVLRDHGARLWLGTDDGVFVADEGGLRQLSSRHGLAGRETNRGAAIVDRLGRVWIGTDRGLSVYRERHDLDPPPPPRVEIRAVEAAGERRAADALIDLGPHERALTLHVAPIAFSDEELLLRYRLDGFDEGWQGPSPSSTTAIRYTNLPPGRFRFRIGAAWARGRVWGEEATSGEIRIAPPLWRRLWFQASAGLALALALAGAHELRTRAMSRRNAALSALNARLEEAVAERQRLIGELEARNADLERFIYTVSHDLKSPLVTVRGFLGYLEKDAEAGNLERMRADIERLKDASARMAHLLEELLELSRIGRVSGPTEPVSLAELAREATTTRPELEGVEVAIAPDLPTVAGERSRLLEVLENLVGNAAKFRGDQRRLRIEIGVRAGTTPPVIFVADNGRGIDPRYHGKVFGLFERLDPAVEGAGVGLAITRRIVELHGGRIWVESEGAGKGSTFCFTLPGRT